MKEASKKLNVLNPRLNLITILSYIFGGTIGLWSIFGTYVAKIIASIIYGLLLIAVIIYFIKNKRKPEKPVIDVLLSDRELLNSFKLRGIVGIQEENQLNYSKLAKKLTEPIQSIKIMVYYGDILLNNIREQLIKVINADTKVQLLIAKEDSKLMQEVLEIENAKKLDKYNDVEKIINEIKDKTKWKPDKFEWFEYSTQIRYALIVIDDKWAWWTPYHPGVITEQSTSFELVNAGDKSFIHLCISHFEKLWKKMQEEQHN